VGNITVHPALPSQQRIRVSEDVMVEKRGEQVIETAREARQAEPGPSVRNVLVISTTAVIIAFAVIWLMFFNT
jgi:hypothetical protein